MEGFITVALGLALIAASGRIFPGLRPRRPAGAGRGWLWFMAAGIIISSWFPLATTAQDDPQQKLAGGEILVSAEETRGTTAKRAEMMAVIEAPPEIVWQIITDVNNFKFFMPQTINSITIAAEKLPLILEKKPRRAEEVEHLLGPVPADPARFRINGGKYTVYHYSHLEFPWPANNRWYIVKVVNDETSAGQNRYRNSWTLVAGNLKENSGEWLLEPFGAGKTKATYRLLTDPGGAIPGFLIERGTQITMPKIIIAIRERAAKLCGRR
jgi:ribosome-associated toxin RatA of RatAB toxin-antitoxin module